MEDLKDCPFYGKKPSYNFNADLEPDGVACAYCRILVKFMNVRVENGNGDRAMDEMAWIWNERAR